MLPFGRFPGVDTVLGPEMKSTGEVMGIDADSGMALAKAMVAAGHALPTAGTVFVSVANRDKRAIVFPAKRLADLGFRLLATGGTAGVLQRAGIPVERVAKVSEGPDNVAELIRGGSDRPRRQHAVRPRPAHRRLLHPHGGRGAGVPCITTLPGVFAAVRGIEALRGRPTEPRSIQEYHAEAMAEPTQVRLTFEQAAAGGRGGAAGVKRVRAEVLSTRTLGAYHSLTLVAPEIAEKARPGQFLAVQMPEGREFLLRRHFSIHQASRRGGWAGTLEFVVDPPGAGHRVARDGQGARVPRRDRAARQGRSPTRSASRTACWSRRGTARRRCTSWPRSCSPGTSGST